MTTKMPIHEAGPKPGTVGQKLNKSWNGMTSVWRRLVPFLSQNSKRVGGWGVYYPSKNLPKSQQNGVGCLTCPGCFSSPSTEHDSLSSLWQREPRFCPLLQADPGNHPSPQTLHFPAEAWAPRASQRGGRRGAL